jgi:hypothetical protein
MATNIVKSKPRAKATRKAAPKMATPRPTKKWSHDVTEHSDALDLQRDVFKLDDPKKIAASLKRSAERSHRRKSAPYRSAMSMLTFYINRAGHNLAAKRKRVLERAKDELRKAFGKDA